MRYHEFLRTVVCTASSLALALTLGMAGATLAFGDENAQNEAASSVASFEEASKAYLEAEQELQTIEQKIADNEVRQAELEERLPAQRQRTAASVKAMYLFQQSSSGLLDLVLSSEDFNDFITTVRYIDAIQQRNTAEINALVDLETELVNTQAELSAQRDAATKKRDEADSAMAEASSALRDARAAQRILQDAGDLAALQAAAAQESPASAESTSSSSEHSEQQESGSQSSSSASQGHETSAQEQTQVQQSTPAPQPSSPSTPSSSSSGTSTEEWAARIDAYLEGTELAGHGADFAAAAEQYGVDPRISPAISRIESGSGQVCFKPHNAWGWGTASWDNWTSAIYGHVSGFSEGYGSTLTLDGAQWYAGTNMYGEWYNLVQDQMSQI